MPKIIIIDTGCANLSSVKFAFDRLGYQAEISQSIAKIQQADKLLLPGVGTANAAMEKLAQRGLIEVIKEAEQPILGICLGMQLMTSYSDEGNVDTLDIIPSKTSLLPSQGLPLPHMGWNSIRCLTDNPLFTDIPSGSYFYFVHSYAVLNSEYTIATCDYGVEFSAVLNKDNFYGVQFHPERSGKVGAKLLQNFIENC